MRKKPTVTIGIPAYNEEENIGKLLKRLLSQKRENYVLDKIIVVSDASTDKTNLIVKSFKNKKVKLIRFENHSGQSIAQNRILRETSSDILLLIEADTLPFGEDTIQNLIKPLSLDGSLAMSVCKSVAVKPTTFVEKVLYKGHELKADVFKEWKNGLNIYSARGQAMKALTSTFYKTLFWPNDVPEDSYTYLRLKESGMGMIVVEGAKVYFRLPATLKDRMNHNVKFYTGKSALREHFPKSLLESEYRVPVILIITKSLNHFLKSPFWTIFVIGESILMNMINGNKTGFKTIYSPLLSTKNLEN